MLRARRAVVSDHAGAYVETDATFQHGVTQECNHRLGEIVTCPELVVVAADDWRGGLGSTQSAPIKRTADR